MLQVPKMMSMLTILLLLVIGTLGIKAAGPVDAESKQCIDACTNRTEPIEKIGFNETEWDYELTPKEFDQSCKYYSDASDCIKQCPQSENKANALKSLEGLLQQSCADGEYEQILVILSCLYYRHRELPCQAPILMSEGNETRGCNETTSEVCEYAECFVSNTQTFIEQSCRMDPAPWKRLMMKIIRAGVAGRTQVCKIPDAEVPYTCKGIFGGEK